MSADSLKTLFHPFDVGALPPPAPGTRALFLGAEPGFRLPDGFAADLTLIQGFRPQVLALEKAGHRVIPTPEGEDYDLALVLAGRHRGLNELRIADALERVRPGGMILVAGGKEDGIGPLRRTIEALIPFGDHLSKYHGAVFWLTRPAGEDLGSSAGHAARAAAALRAANPPMMLERRYETRPGMFSHGRVDPGSRLLADSLPERLAGVIADFCAGWGYVAGEVASRCAGVNAMDLYEADFRSLQAARENLGRVVSEADTAPQRSFFWRDLIAEPVSQRYDSIVMNPPFHAGRAAEPDLGQALIAAAAKALKGGGRLFMVANRNLPYEKALAGNFAESGELARSDAFKVLYARR